MLAMVWIGISPVISAQVVAVPASAPKKPSILFSCAVENRYGYVGYDYMEDLAAKGWTVDYIEGAKELTWDKVKGYNVLVVFNFPQAGPVEPVGSTLFAPKPPWAKAYVDVLDKYVQAGGGLFLHYCSGFGGVAPNELLKPWGVQFPLLWIKDPSMQMMSNIPSEPLAYTDQILPSPVSDGIKGFWYPLGRFYLGQATMPILVDANWQVVARPGKSAYTDVPRYDRGESQPLPGALVPAEPVKDPALFAIRSFENGGRMAAIQTWYQWSLGSGDKWLFNSQVLSEGVGNRPSDYGQLLENTFTWLAEPSLQSGTVGGATPDPNRIVEPMLRAGAINQFHEWEYEEEEILEYRRPPTNGKIYRGLIGAQTVLSGGEGSVADWAKAAADLKLDFLVFLEDMVQFDAAKLDTLKAEVKAHSTATLQLFAGYRMKANTGNYIFHFGENPVWPEARLLMGDDERTFNLQYQNADGIWDVGNPAVDWCINNGRDMDNTIGYYNFTRSGNGLKMYDLRVYSMAAIRTYEAGKLVEDMTADYLTTCQSTAVPTPVSLNLVRSPDEMRRAVADESLTYAQARTLPQLFQDALRWNSSYDGLNVFLSNGPVIEAWPKCRRTMTFGAEKFVSGRSMVPSPVHVTSAVGLKEIRIYNGRVLFRRFLCNGAKEFETTLIFPNTTQQSMVLVAEDVQGGTATSFAYRQYKEGSLCPVFCADHVNDCGHMLLAHGSHWPMLFMTPKVPDAGFTWDGGPAPTRPLLPNQFTPPAVRTDKGDYLASTPYQVPLLEFSDESVTRCRMVSDRVLAQGVPEGNPWRGFGPLEPSPIVDLWASHTFFNAYQTGVMPNAYGAPCVNEGPIASLFTEQLTFKEDCTVKEIRLYHGGWRLADSLSSTLLAFGQGDQLEDVWDMTDAPDKPQQFHLAPGGWFALFSGQLANAHLFVNRGGPLLLQANPKTAYWLQLFADLAEPEMQTGQTYDVELSSQVWPLNRRPKTAAEIAGIVAYLVNPTGMNLIRGKQVAGLGGLLELTPDNFAVELSIPKPDGVERTVPLRVDGFNPRWSVGLYQVAGWRTHYYSKADSGWRALGLDFDHRAYIPLYVSKAANTHVLIGHPVVADAAGRDLFIQTTRINDGLDGKPPAWHVSVNNPLDTPVTTTLKRAMNVPGLEFTEAQVTLQPGEYRVLSPVMAVAP
ncbi:MAG: hypothetical protein HQ523_02560 [Lentisphaerae bacterium]|nr:hypothetical protein [Lentisphaerota bacterium]